MGARMFRLSSTLFLSLALGGASAAGCGPGQQQQRQPPAKPKADKRPPGGGVPTETPAAGSQQEQPLKTAEPVKPDGGPETLAAGGHSQVREPFVFVARDPQTYTELRRLAGELPELRDEFFRAGVVVAAFLGQRRTGGYAVEIAREADGALRVSEKSPPKDAMTTMALTASFRVVSYATPDENPVRLRLDAAWRQALRPYRVVLGEFTMMGGFAGVREPFNVTGTLGLMRHQDLATVIFDLAGDDAGRPRALADAASGKFSAGKLTLSVDPGTFVLPPRRRMITEVKAGPGENKLHFTLDGMQAAVADGFGGRGKFDAEATSAPPKKIALDDDPL